MTAEQPRGRPASQGARLAGGAPLYERGRNGLRLRSLAYGEIKEQLLEGRWSAGERLSLEVFKSAFGMSKQPIMEALRRLEADGLVVIVPQVGCQVATYDPSDVRDFFTVFAAFEGSIAGVAAARRSPADLAALRVVHERIGALGSEPAEGRRSRDYRLLNREFHGAIHAMARSNIVGEMSLRMWDLSDFLINTSGQPQPLGSALVERQADHQTVYDALLSGDAAQARARMEAHVLSNVALIECGRRDGSGS